MIDAAEYEKLNGSYFQNQHCATQWRSFIQVFIEEIFKTAGEQDACAFLRHMGARIAHLHPIAVYDSIEELERSMNQILSRLDWGWVKVQPQDYSLEFYHGAFPLPSFGKAEAEREAKIFSAMLEGLYHSWMVALGGNPEVVMKTRKALPGAPFELVYAKQSRTS